MKYSYTLLIVLSLVLTSCSQQQTSEEYITEGETYIEKKEWKSAIIEFKNAIKQSPGNARARTLLGKSYLHTYSSNAAIKELKKAIELGGQDDEVIVFLGRAYEQLNQNDNIFSEINIKKSQSPSIQADIYSIRAKALLRANQLQKAKEALELARSLDENKTDVRLAWALYESKLKNIESQRKWLEPLLERNGGVADAWSQLAEIEVSSGDSVKAEAAYSRAINLRKIVHLDYIRRALIRITQQNYKGAAEDLNILKNAGATWPVVGHAEGLMAYQQADYDQAQTLFSQVLSSHPTFSPSQLLIGLTHFQKGNYQNAIKSLELYLATYPEAEQANFIYAASLIKLRKVSIAIPVLEKLSQTYPGNDKVLSLLGNAYLQENQNEKGIKVLRKVVSLKPAKATTRLQLGSALMREKSGLAKAQQELVKAIELDPELFQADLALYMSYMRNKEFTKAERVAKALKQKQQKNSLGSNLLALIYIAEGKKSQAIEELKSALNLFPADPLSSSNLAKIFLQDNQLTDAKKLYLAVLDKHPDNLKIYNQMALISAREKNQPAVLEWLKKAVDNNPKALSSRLILASQYLRENNPNLAIKLLQSSATDQKDQPGYVLLMAKSKMSVGEYQHAIRSLKSLLVKKPDLISAQILLAQAYATQDRKDKVRELLSNALNFRPDNIQANLMMARLDLFERKFDKFKARVAYLIKNYPENKDVQFLNAKVQSSEKGYASAIKTLTDIMSETPNSDVVIDLARNQWASGDKGGAITGVELWLQGHPGDQKALMVLAQYYLAENRNAEAKKTYLSLDKVLPDNSLVLNNLAWLMKDTDIKQGIVYASKALKIEPDSPFIQDTLAMLYLEQGDVANALKYSTRAAEKLPNLFEIQINYARVLLANNKTNKAKQLLDRLLKNERDYDKRKAIQKELARL